MNKNSVLKIQYGLLITVFIVIAGCARNPLASDSGGGGGNPPPALSNAVVLSKNTLSNNELWVAVKAENISADVFGAAFHITFDPAILQYNTWSEGDFFSAGSATYLVDLKNSDPDSGELIVGVTYNNPNTQNSGSGVILNIMFDIIGAGDAELGFIENHLQNNIPADIEVSGGWHGLVVRR